uniref:Outer membrane protein assembly factor BamB n=1 Tax=uncultured Alphaproteobacteria bacterium TaxID=91750 RepID=A0A6G8F308_9PROT|nr:outer membrane protein assembly factor BamB [uncultured Alphaproteobacteria bacterium]
MVLGKKTAVAAAVIFVLAGCGKEKLVIDGQRVPVLDAPEVIAADYMKGDIKISLPEPTITSHWSQAGGNPQHNAGHIASNDELKKLWSKSFGTGNSKRDYLIAQPVIAENKIFAIDANAIVSAYDKKDGKQLWRLRLKPQLKEDKGVALKGAGLAYAHGKIYAATGFGGVFAIDAENGKIIWKNYEKTPIRIAPTTGGNKVFVQTIENVLVALNQTDGSEIWRYAAQNEDTVLVGGAAPAYDASMDILIAGFSNGEIRAIKASTGSPLWGDYLVSSYHNNMLSEINAIRANPVIGNSMVFAAGNNILTAIDMRTGQRLWEREFGSNNQPWLAGKILYVLSEISHLLAIDTESGKIIWDTKVPAGEKVADAVGVTFAGPVLVNNRLLINTSNGYTFYISPYTGEIMGFLKLDDGSAVSPVAADGQIVITTTDAELLVYE